MYEETFEAVNEIEDVHHADYRMLQLDVMFNRKKMEEIYNEMTEWNKGVLESLLNSEGEDNGTG